jgi:hypothetical protein
MVPSMARTVSIDNYTVVRISCCCWREHDEVESTAVSGTKINALNIHTGAGSTVALVYCLYIQSVPEYRFKLRTPTSHDRGTGPTSACAVRHQLKSKQPGKHTCIYLHQGASKSEKKCHHGAADHVAVSEVSSHYCEEPFIVYIVQLCILQHSLSASRTT